MMGRNWGAEHKCWSQHADAATFHKYYDDAAKKGSAIRKSNYSLDIVDALGFVPEALGGKWLPNKVLGHLTEKVLEKVRVDLPERLDASVLKLLAEADQATSAGMIMSDDANSLKEFLETLGKDYIQRRSAQGEERAIRFTEPSLLSLESADAYHDIHDMSLIELEELLHHVVEAGRRQHGSEYIPPALKRWYSAPIMSDDFRSFGVAMHNFLKQNKRLCAERKEDELSHC
eukprot:736653-Amphidinium_carterae.1